VIQKRHLLGKKSWNVYNADNIARVRRDEAAAKAAEEAEEQRMQEVDAQRRLAILRGELPPPLPEPEPEDGENSSATKGRLARDGYPGDGRRKHKRQGEDDTDFELRLATERHGAVNVSTAIDRKPTSSAPIVDHMGHIDLFGDEKQRAHSEKNEEAEKQRKKKEREFEDKYTMRFSNASGKNNARVPWYSTSSADLVTEAPTVNVWGNEDPKRKERQMQRTLASDPLAMMKSGAAKIKEIKRERKKFQEEREAEMKEMRREERRRERRDSRRDRPRSPERDGSRRSRSRERDAERRRHRSRSRDEVVKPRIHNARHNRSHRDRSRRKEEERHGHYTENVPREQREERSLSPRRS
jgi:hypothetical protein